MLKTREGRGRKGKDERSAVSLNSVSFLWVSYLKTKQTSNLWWDIGFIPEFRLNVSGIKLVHADTETAQIGSVCIYLSHAWGDGGRCDEDDIGSKLSCPEDL